MATTAQNGTITSCLVQRKAWLLQCTPGDFRDSATSDNRVLFVDELSCKITAFTGEDSFRPHILLILLKITYVVEYIQQFNCSLKFTFQVNMQPRHKYSTSGLRVPKIWHFSLTLIIVLYNSVTGSRTIRTLDDSYHTERFVPGNPIENVKSFVYSQQDHMGQ